MQNRFKNLWGKLFFLLFTRSGNTDDLREYSCFRIGLSAAASWSWGVSLAVGMWLMYAFGILPASIWMIGNVLAIPLFGFIYTHFPSTRNWPKFLPMILMFFVVEVFVIIMNLQGILTGLGGKIKSIETYVFHFNIFGFEIPHFYIVLLIGFLVIAYIRKGGLRLSVLTDVGQYTTQFVFVVFLAIAGYIIGQGNGQVLAAGSPEFISGLQAWNGPEWLYSLLYSHGAREGLQWAVVKDGVPIGMNWIKFGFFGIITGAIGTGHQWQRFTAIEDKNVLRSSLWGGFLFGIYMIFVFLSGLFFHPHVALGVAFLIAMLALGTSSIDSGVAGLEYVCQKLNIKIYWATIFSLALLFLWPLLINMGMANQWTLMAKIRCGTVCFMAACTAIYYILKKNNWLNSLFQKTEPGLKKIKIISE